MVNFWLPPITIRCNTVIWSTRVYGLFFLDKTADHYRVIHQVMPLRNGFITDSLKELPALLAIGISILNYS